MEEKSASAPSQGQVTEQKSEVEQREQATPSEPRSVPAAKAGEEGRQVYGTAKTENLRDSGWWRVVIPVFVILLCLALLAIPLIILIPLLITSLDPHTALNQSHISLWWLWIIMIILEVGLAAVIIRGLINIFMTQAGNYRR